MVRKGRFPVVAVQEFPPDFPDAALFAITAIEGLEEALRDGYERLDLAYARGPTVRASLWVPRN
jgi:hypothetical protein